MLAPNVGTLDINSEGSITLKEGEIKYPVDYDANFEGKGTENEPYLIKTVDNLNALASVVNKTKCPAGQTTVLVFPDTYFRLDADLDLQNVPFTAIGAEQYHTFAGDSTVTVTLSKISSRQIRASSVMEAFSA